MYRPTPALAGPGQPEVSPPRTSIAGTLKPHPPVSSRRPCPRCPAVQVTTPSPCPVPVHDRSVSISSSAYFFFFGPVRPTYALSRSHHPTVHCLAAIPKPPTTHLASSGPTRSDQQQPKHTDPTSPPAAAVSSELRPTQNTTTSTARPPPAPPVRGRPPNPGPGGKAVPPAATLAARRTRSLVRPAC